MVQEQLTIDVGDGNDSDATTGERQPRSLLEPHPATTDQPPRVRRVWVRSLKGFSDFEATLGNFNVLAGANNSGKSTLLQSIHLLYALLKLHSQGDRLVEGRMVPATILPVAMPSDLFHRRVWREGNVYVYATVGAEFVDGSHVEMGIRHLFGSMNSRVLSESGMEGARLAALLSKPAVWVPSSVGIVRDEEYRTPARQTGLINAGRHNEVLRNLLLDLHAKGDGSYELLQQTLTERFGAHVTDVTFDPNLDQFVAADYENEAGVQHDLYSAGSGFVQIVQLLAFILSSDCSIILLDEPDAHLHSSLQRVVVEILEELAGKRSLQVLLATHSKEIINFVDPSRLLLVESDDHGTMANSVDATPVAILKSLGAVDNVDAYTLVKNRRCLFLEGTSDATIIGRFAAILGVHSLTGDERVVVVPVGGADKFEHIAQLNVFEALLGESISSLEIRDRDGRTDEHRDVLMNDSARDLYVLDRDCIESYLLHPTVIARVVEEVTEERGTPARPSPDDIEELILNLADAMKVDTEDRLAQRYLDDVRARTGAFPTIPQANTEARQLVEASWESLDGRLRVVSGKALLGRLRQEIQANYGASFGNERLAEAFDRSDIAGEIQWLIPRLESL